MTVEPLAIVVERLQLVEALEVADAQLGKFGDGCCSGLGFDGFIEFLHAPPCVHSVVVDDGCELGVAVVEVLPADSRVLSFFCEGFFLAGDCSPDVESFSFGEGLAAGAVFFADESRFFSISSRVHTVSR